VDEVVDPAVCTGCAGCVIACPQHVLHLDTGPWKPVLGEDAWVDGDPGKCIHGERGCTVCARACPRFRLWDPDIDELSVARTDREHILGSHRAILMVQATDEAIAAAGQDGGLATAALVYALEHGDIEAALVSGYDEGLRPHPVLARTRAELLQCAGSRYTYSANTLALEEADRQGLKLLGLVSMGCQTSIPSIAFARGARKLARRFALTIGLLCSKTFTDDIYGELIVAEYGVDRNQITKTNIKGRLQVWYEDGEAGYLEVPLKACRAFTRPGCDTCPDFSAENSDLSLGGIGRDPGKTITIVRTDRGADLLDRMEADGWITVADATVDDPDAVTLVEKLAATQKRRWPIPEPTST
jgi:coenzyme F420 hydrogenase subunit beta